MAIKKSCWVLDKVYFEVELVEGFREKYISWIYKYDGITEGTCGLDEFLDSITSLDTVLLYQYPEGGITTTGAEDLHDYFEKEDDNFVIPFDLFTVKENKIEIS